MSTEAPEPTPEARARAIRAVLGRPIGSTPVLEVFIREMWKLLRWVLTRVGERDVAAVRRREAHPFITTTHTSLSHRPIPGLTKNNIQTSQNLLRKPQW